MLFEIGVLVTTDGFYGLILYGLGCLFLISPIVVNIIQLQKAIDKWTKDNDTRAIISPWIASYGKILYLLTIITGSAFGAVELCDSHLFQLEVFSLDLPKRHKQVFKNQRIFSIVLLENIPQFILQLIYLTIFTTNVSTNNSEAYITVIAMFFSVMSIILTLFEYSSKKMAIESEYVMIITFKIESQGIRIMSKNQFQKTIVNQRNDITYQISKILNVDYYQMEQLKPIRCDQGVLITCHIRSDISIIQTGDAMNKLQNSVETHRLPQVIRKSYQLDEIPQVNDIQVAQHGPENEGKDAVATISVRSKPNTNSQVGLVPKVTQLTGLDSNIVEANGPGWN